MSALSPEEVCRLQNMWAFEGELLEKHGATCAIGLDEVGRGPLAGPLVVGAVILPQGVIIEGLNDSKQVPEKKRLLIAERIYAVARGYATVFVDAGRVDSDGITRSLKSAFKSAAEAVVLEVTTDEDSCIYLLDGLPMHLSEREVNVIHGDARCPSIAAASIIAKCARDQYMLSIAHEFPEYGFDRNKGYGTAAHMEAIRKFGLCPYHRRSFCSSFFQDPLF